MSLTQYITGAINQIMAVDGTTAVLDAIHGALAFTKTGGVGNTWPGDPSNFMAILGAQAPVIAEATTNILTAQTASLEGAGVGDWIVATGTVLSAAGGYHGSKELQLTCVVSNENRVNLTNLVAANTTNTFSCWVKAKNAGAVGLTVKARAYGDNSGFSYGTTVTLTTSWQYITITKTHTVGDSTWRQFTVICTDTADAGDIISIDAAQLEAKAYPTPFAFPGATPSRTDCAMTIPTATIGLTAGMPLTIMAVVNFPWDGTSVASHTLYSCGVNGTTNRVDIVAWNGTLYFECHDAATTVYGKTMVIDAANFAANTDHVVIMTRDIAGTINGYLAGTAAGTTLGTVRTENAVPASLSVGTDTLGGSFLNGAILCAMWGRVLTGAEITALSAPATWASVIDLPQITVTGLAAGNAARLYDAAGNIHASAVETGGTATLTYTLD